jgi:carboxyl-terminal processing protease
MRLRLSSVGSLIFLLALTSPLRADAPVKSDPMQACFERFEKTSALIMDRHLDPPTFQEMFLGGMQGLFTRAGIQAPADLSKRVSRLVGDEQFRAFLKENWPKIEANQAATPAQLQSAFVEGLLQRLPEHVDLIPAPEARALDQSAANRYVGTGIQVTFNAKEKRPQITIALAHGPLRKAGGKSGDFIMAIDGVDTSGMQLRQAVEKLRGLEGSTVSMTLQQPGAKEPRVLKVTRGPVPFDTVVGYKRLGEESWQYRVAPDEPLAYVRLAGILPSTPGELRKLEKTLLDDGVKGLVLDLRSNDGDDVQAAALTADELLDGGLMFRLRDNKKRTKDFRADRDCILRGIPMVVLVNEFSRGSAEFIAAALQDNHRAVVVGAPSHGDGVVTTLILLADDLGGMKLPTGRVERAAGAMEPSAAWRPITPDHVVAVSREKSAPIMSWQSEQMSPDASAKEAKLPPEDPQLAQALAILRAK